MDNNTIQSTDSGGIPEPSGIFLKPEFPSKTKKTEFTPQQVYNAIVYWATNKDGIDQCIEMFGIRRQQFWILREAYPEIRSLHEVARKLHGEQLVLKARDCYDEPPDTAYMTDKWGNRQLSQSWVTYNRDKSSFLLRLAQIRETGTTIPRTQTQAESVNYNVNVYQKAPSDVAKAAGSIEELIDEDPLQP